jgi:hypothetical protein
MLVDNIKRYNATDFFKLINVENYLANGHNIPSQIHSVPALMFRETKKLIFGKQVFDYLLLPSKGFLLNLPKSGSAPKDATALDNNAPTDEPNPFALCAGIGSGDNFSFIDENVQDTQKGYNWCDLNSKITIDTPQDATNNLEKDEKSKKKMPDIATLRSQRDLDIQQTTPADAQAAPMIATV